VFAREAASKVAFDGLRWVVGAGAADSVAGPTPLESSLGLDAVCSAQVGLIADMDRVADAIYGRVRAS
jgi:hypothetical protein